MEINRAPKKTVTLDNDSIDVNIDEPLDVNIFSPVDDNTEAVLTIDYPHHEIHEGSHYTYSTSNNNLDIGGNIDILVINPDVETYAHMISYVYGALQTRFYIYEAATHTNNVQQNVYNNNRNSSKTPGVTVYTSNNDGANGTLIFSTEFGISTGAGTNARSGGGAGRNDAEWILKRNTKYLFRIQSGSTDNVVNMILSWYEHATV